VVVSVIVFLNAGGAISRDFDRLDYQNSIVNTWRDNVATQTGSGVQIYSDYGNSTVAIPVATVYFLLAPFPWEILSGSVRNAFGGIENLFIIFILIKGFPALRIVFIKKFVDLAPIFVFCALYAGFHIWSLSNVGLAWRHKQTIMPLLFMLAAVGITQREAGWNLLKQRVLRNRSAMKRPLGAHR